MARLLSIFLWFLSPRQVASKVTTLPSKKFVLVMYNAAYMRNESLTTSDNVSTAFVYLKYN